MRLPMNRVLILAYDFPPYTSIAAQRPASWHRYFKESGVEPVVVTRHWDGELKSALDCFRASAHQTVTLSKEDNGVTIRVPYTQNIRDKMLTRFGEQRFVLLRKFLSLLHEIVKFHSFFFDNRKGIYTEARKALSQQRFDAIIATGEPFLLFRYAHLLSREFHVPWIADYRDGWSTDRINPPKTIAQKLLMRHARFVEKKLIASATLLTTASPTYKKDLQELFPSKQIEVIYNGYDEDTLQSLPPAAQDDKIFRIAYAGTLYPYQKVEMFLEGFKKFTAITQAQNAKVLFYGLQFHPQQAHRVLSFDPALAPYLELEGKLSYSETLQKLQKASVLLLLGAKGNDTLSAKIFDYLAVNRKILFVQNDHGVLHALIRKHCDGICCDNAAEVCDALVRCYSEHTAKGAVASRVSDVLFYTRKNQAARLAQLLQQVR